MGRKKKAEKGDTRGVVQGRNKVKVTVWMSKDARDRIDSYAKNAGKSRSAWIEEKAS